MMTGKWPTFAAVEDRPTPVKLALAARAEPVVRTTFERFEIKYWVTPRVADRVVRFASPYLEHDPFSRNGATTRNVSLYLDTRGHRFHAMHTSGAPERVKLRVRTYGDPPEVSLDPQTRSGRVAFFEIKRKVKNVTLKARATLPIELVPAVLAGRTSLAECPPAERKHLESFLFLAAVHRVEPKVLVSSRREAFVSRLRGHDVRMTIDREITYQPTHARSLVADPARWVSLASRALVELKFLGAAPAWMAEMVSRFELHQEGFSKYIAAIDHLQGRAGENDDR